MKYYKDRTLWLEREVQQHFNVSCADLATGTSLRPSLDRGRGNTDGQMHHSPASAPLPLPPGETGPQEAAETLFTGESLPEAGLVALNATGDMRFLGPSSGVFFALYANTFAQLGGPDHDTSNHNNIIEVDINRDIGPEGAEAAPLASETIHSLLQSYRTWIEPLYPVIDTETVDTIISKYSENQDVGQSSTRTSEDVVDLSIFYLILALGALNQDSTSKLVRGKISDATSISSATLCHKALKLLNNGAQSNLPSITTIQILLLFSIYSMHGSTTTNQWQLVGSAVRVGFRFAR